MAYGGGAVSGKQGGQGFRKIVSWCERGAGFEACRRDLLIEWGGLKLWVVATFAVAGVLLARPGAAQTNEVLLQERLISPVVFDLLQQRGATTPEQRLQVIREACGSGQLGLGDCPHLRPRR